MSPSGGQLTTRNTVKNHKSLAIPYQQVQTFLFVSLIQCSGASLQHSHCFLDTLSHFRLHALSPGTATGARRNRPHPEKNFIIYRQKPRYTYSEQGDWSQPLSDDRIKEVLGSRAKSTYTVDYLGRSMDSGLRRKADWRRCVKQSSYNMSCHAIFNIFLIPSHSGIPQAFQISQSHEPTQDWTDKVPYRTDQSLQRDSYQQPNQAPVLMNNITRYGCNADR